MKNNQRNFFIIKLIILIILVIIVIICSFKTGQKFYLLKNTYFDTTMSKTNFNIARWYFNATIKYEN